MRSIVARAWAPSLAGPVHEPDEDGLVAGG